MNDIASLIDYRVYVISADLHGKTHLDIVGNAIMGGATVIQYRDKSPNAGYEVAQNIREITRQANIPFIVNDWVDVAKMVKADGLHIGQSDVDIDSAREVLNHAIIGVSCKTLDEALKAERSGADYIGVGPIFDTSTKIDAGKSIGIDILKTIVKHINIPVVAIGGISLSNIQDVIASGVSGAAVISAIASSDNISQTTRMFRKAWSNG